MKSKAIWLGLSMLAATTAGCAFETYEHEPAYPAQEAGPPVAIYPVPPGAPRGSVNVMSLGIERLPVPAGQPDSFLHVRIAAENTGDDVPWLLDPNDQVLTAPGQSAAPSFAEGSAGGPVVRLAKGARGYLDVFYPAPPVNQVTLAWKLHRGNEVVPGSTALDRVTAPDQSSVGYEPAYGPQVHVGIGLGWWWWPDYYLWWHGPFWWGGYPRYWGWGGYYHPRYYGGGRGYYGGGRGYYGGGRGYYGGGGGGNWRSGGGGHSGGAGHAAPSGGGSHGGGGGWRSGGHR
jgi:hypothetical protein